MPENVKRKNHESVTCMHNVKIMHWNIESVNSIFGNKFRNITFIRKILGHGIAVLNGNQ